MSWAVAIFGGFWLFGALNWSWNPHESMGTHGIVQAAIGGALIVAAVIAHAIEDREEPIITIRKTLESRSQHD